MRLSREYYIELMTFGHIDRQMLIELFKPLTGVPEAWKLEGASEEEINLMAFDLDYVPVADCGGVTGIFRGSKPEVLEENSEYIIERDIYGRKTKLYKYTSSVAHPLDYPVHDIDSWQKIKHSFVFSKERIVWDKVYEAERLQKEGYIILAKIPGGFDLPRNLMGEENACICYYDNPELMHDIMNTVSDTAFRVLDIISDKISIDNLQVHEDLAGKSGSLIGPKQINEYIKPYYRKVWDMLYSKGTKLFSQDSDGNINSVIDTFLDCGVNIMYPMEPAAGMDIVKLRKKYGKRTAFKGGIDKFSLLQDKHTIIKELEYKLQPLMQQGGIAFGLDHHIVNGTPIENYRFYIDTAREILGIPARDEQNKGWGRMGF